MCLAIVKMCKVKIIPQCICVSALVSQLLQIIWYQNCGSRTIVPEENCHPNPKLFLCSCDLRKETQKQPPDVFCKKGVLRNFARFTGKQTCRPEACNFMKKETLSQVFSCKFFEFSIHLFYRTPLGDCFQKLCKRLMEEAIRKEAKRRYRNYLHSFILIQK